MFDGLLDPVIFADDPLSYDYHKDIKYLFTVVNKKLVDIEDWFIANKLSLNLEETNILILP